METTVSTSRELFNYMKDNDITNLSTKDKKAIVYIFDIQESLGTNDEDSLLVPAFKNFNNVKLFNIPVRDVDLKNVIH
jgi:pyruvate/2-oxoglutarate dehydrogenase complex dihydrolipoamide acyltransferase (E2) component